MKQLSSADFRKNYAKETEPVEVTAWGKVIGRWTPEGADIEAPPLDGEQPLVSEPASEVEPRMTIRPALRDRRPLQQQIRRIQDPLELRRLEDERNEALASRTYGHRKRDERTPV